MRRLVLVLCLSVLLASLAGAAAADPSGTSGATGPSGATGDQGPAPTAHEVQAIWSNGCGGANDPGGSWVFAQVNPQGSATTATFQVTFGSEVREVPAERSPGSGTEDYRVQARVAGPQPDAVAVVATSARGTTRVVGEVSRGPAPPCPAPFPGGRFPADNGSTGATGVTGTGSPAADVRPPHLTAVRAVRSDGRVTLVLRLDEPGSLRVTLRRGSRQVRTLARDGFAAGPVRSASRRCGRAATGSRSRRPTAPGTKARRATSG